MFLRVSQTVKSLLVTFIALVLSPGEAWAERLFPERTPGRYESEHANTGAEAEWRNDLLVKINSSDLPEFTRYTPTLVSGLIGLWQRKLSNRISLRVDAYGAGVYERESEDTGGPTTESSQAFAAYGLSTALGLETSNQIKVFGGADLKGETSRTIERNNAGLQSTQETEGHFLWRPLVGLTKSSSAWFAGAFYAFGDEAEVTQTTEVLGDTRSVETFVFLAPKIGGFFQSAIGSALRLGAELDFILGSSSSLKSGDQSVLSDSYRAHFHVIFQRSGKSSLWLGISHQTASYANQNFIGFETIPITDFEASYRSDGGFLLGAILSYADDKQSTEEINRNFQIYGLSLRTGYKLPMK